MNTQRSPFNVSITIIKFTVKSSIEKLSIQLEEYIRHMTTKIDTRLKMYPQVNSNFADSYLDNFIGSSKTYGRGIMK